ncbi:histidine kinase with GAF domain [Arthrobacter crystallopoietes BAB-32]|uniref:Histidine kinase with GAF domain n=1 Tax=Arthrobacter crystallopoietes BAB-32 TaxID=1246476 RepID=N1UV14_9MICC|nr:GAF domain-containing protein [Arthrobacter crystallopoietes]EMY32880.1 histidine kinase with GAF domain [Arthrobacter crystallopoietes BAB-32]
MTPWRVNDPSDLARAEHHIQELVSAIVSIAENHSLETILDQVVQTACNLVDARYGALGVIATGQILERFITVGLTPEEIERIGPLPVGHGVLGLLIRDPKPIRMHELGKHPDSYGFPPGHPPMKSFLGVPIRVSGQVLGNLYLTEKKGGGDFTEADEEVVVSLAAAAGVAVANARLFAQSERREQWLEASMEVGSGVSARTANPGDIIVQQALTVPGWALAGVGFPADDGTRLRVSALGGELAGQLALPAIALHSPLLSQLWDEEEPIVLEDASGFLGAKIAAALGPLLLTPLCPQEGPKGVLFLGRKRDAGPLAGIDPQMSGIFCTHAALALDAAHGQRLREELVLFEDRDRIARDLHDVVIQRLFAAGLSLQSLRRYTTETAVQDRITAVAADLDETIRQLRDTIYSLKPAGSGDLLSSRILQTVQNAMKSMPFSPRVRMDGGVDGAVPERVAGHLLAVLTEALSNAIRHAGASSIDVAVTVREAEEGKPGSLELLVEDNGSGINGDTRSSGLANIEKRAVLLGGIMELASGPDLGTQVRWRVPLA